MEEYGGEFPFCGQCSSQLLFVWELQKKLKELVLTLRKKVEDGESKFKTGRGYQEDKRYYRIRRQIMGGRVTCESAGVENSNGVSSSTACGNLVGVDRDSNGVESSSKHVSAPWRNKKAKINPKPQHSVPNTSTQAARVASKRLSRSPSNFADFSEIPYNEGYNDDTKNTEQVAHQLPKNEPNEEEMGLSLDYDELLDIDNPCSVGTSFPYSPVPTSDLEVDDFESDEPPPKKIRELRRKPPRKYTENFDLEADGDEKKLIPSKSTKKSVARRRPKKSQEESNGDFNPSEDDGDDQFKCSICGKQLSSQRNLTYHLQIHNGVPPEHPCPICNRPFRRSDWMKTHLWSHYSEEEKQEAITRGQKPPSMRPLSKNLQCELCPLAFCTQWLLKSHQRTHFEPISQRQQLCSICGGSFVNLKLHMFLKHQVTSEQDKKHVCGQCGKRFALASGLRGHKEQVHAKEKPWKCEHCPREFVIEKQLKSHLNSHLGIRPFKCQECEASFTISSSLKRHNRIYHEEGSKPGRPSYVRGPEKIKLEERKGRRNKTE